MFAILYFDPYVEVRSSVALKMKKKKRENQDYKL